jgi:hypothetical protein
VLLALLRRELDALPHPSAGRERVLEAVRRLEATQPTAPTTWRDERAEQAELVAR